jgi:hypothetical protein
MSDYSIDGLIRYFQMAHKVMGWKSTDNSYEHHVAEMLKKLRDERDDARRLYCEYVADDRQVGYADHPHDTPELVAKEMGWDCFGKDAEPAPLEDKDYDKPLGGQWVDDGSNPEEEPPYDKYDGVLPGDLGTDRP